MTYITVAADSEVRRGQFATSTMIQVFISPFLICNGSQAVTYDNALPNLISCCHTLICKGWLDNDKENGQLVLIVR